MGEVKKSYILMGLKRCGKTTQGKIIADKRGYPFVDTDALLEQKMRMTARDIYKKLGVCAYAVAEQEACEQISQQYDGKPVIVSAGGGICDNPPALNALRSVGDFVFLNMDIEYAVSRVEDKIMMIKPGYFENAPSYVLAKEPRDLEDVHNILMEKFQDRINQYMHIADIVVNLKNEPIEKCTDAIERLLF